MELELIIGGVFHAFLILDEAMRDAFQIVLFSVLHLPALKPHLLLLLLLDVGELRQL